MGGGRGPIASNQALSGTISIRSSRARWRAIGGHLGFPSRLLDRQHRTRLADFRPADLDQRFFPALHTRAHNTQHFVAEPQPIRFDLHRAAGGDRFGIGFGHVADDIEPGRFDIRAR